MTTNESPPPCPLYREVPPAPAPPPQLIRLDSKKLRVSYKKILSNGFDSLSDDLVLKILAYLPKNLLCQLSRVCRRFYFLAWQPQLWSQIDLSVTNCDEAVRNVLRHHGENVLKICLNNSSGFSDVGLEIIANHCPHLRHLEVKNCRNITNGALQKLLHKCNYLSHLELPGTEQLSR